jgi:hypothetical protein
MEKEKGQIKFTETDEGFRIEATGKDLKDQIKFTETDQGFRIEVTGKDLKEWFSCCCMPMFKGGKEGKSECCPSTDEKK